MTMRTGPRSGPLTGLLAQTALEGAGVVDDRTATTLGALGDRTARLAGCLAALGIAPGDRVAVWMGNSLEWVELWLAIAWAGATIVPLNTRLSAEETAYVLDTADVAWMVRARGVGTIPEEGWVTLAEQRPTLRTAVVVDPAAADPLADLRGEPVACRETADQAGMVLFTSGSTAFPKGAVLRNAALVRNAQGLARAWQVQPHDRVLCVNPLFHCGGSVFAFLVAMVVGATVRITDGWDAQRVGDLMAAEGVTVMPCIDVMLRDLLSRPGLALPALRLVSTAGDADLFRAAAAGLEVEVSNVYGLTECSPNVCVGDLADDLDTRIAWIGRPQPGVEVQLRELDAPAPVPAGSVGEIVVRGWNVMEGYVNDPEATAATFDPDGWLRTGDLGELSDTGHLAFRGRRKLMFKSGGENVAIEEVEAALRTHPDVADAVVVGVPHPRWSEVGYAFVRPDGDRSALTTEDLRAHAEQVLAGFKRPAHYQLVTDVPRTGSGKVDRVALAKVAADEVTATVSS